MEESLTPNPKQRPISSTAPTDPTMTGWNGNKLALPESPLVGRSLRRNPILVLTTNNRFSNCSRTVSNWPVKNKINQKNTWELNLIDHLCDIIKVEDENTNFQKASCTLEAGVKIYSMKVVSVHSEAYKVLGGITRACQYNEDAAGSVENVTNQKKQTERKVITMDLRLSQLAIFLSVQSPLS